MRRILFLPLFVLLTATAWAQDFQVNELAEQTAPDTGDFLLCDEAAGGSGAAVYKRCTLLNTVKATLLDEDDFASDSATQGATQQSIKAYVDTSGLTYTEHTAGATLAVNTDNWYEGSNGAATFTLPLASACTAGDEIKLQIADADAVVDLNLSGGALKWKGAKVGDYISLVCVDVAATKNWFPRDHRETIYLKISVNADESVAAGASKQIVNLTADTDTAALFDAVGDEVDLPALASRIRLNWAVRSNGTAIGAEAKLDAVYLVSLAGAEVNAVESYRTVSVPVVSGTFEATASQSLELWASNPDTDTAHNVNGEAAGNESLATVEIEWVY